MRLTFLGTAAAEGYPALWCRCERCTTARARGGRNLRFRSAVLVNDDLLLDAGPDLLASAVRLGIDLAPVQALLITHPHTDHLDPTAFFWRRRGFVATPLPWLEVYGSQASLARMARAEGRDVSFEPLRLRPHPITALQRFEIVTGGVPEPDDRFPEAPDAVPATRPRRYVVWSLPARHAQPDLEPMLFAVLQVEGPEVEERTGPVALLYATDTGPFLEEAWTVLDRLAAEGIRFGASIIDSTSGLGKDGTAHMNLRQMAAHQAELARRGLLLDGAHRVAHHFSHNGTPPYEELEALLAADGLVPSYDGMTIQW